MSSSNRQIAQLIQRLLRNRGQRRLPKIILSAIAIVVVYLFIRPALERQFGIDLPQVFDSAPPRSTTTGEKAILNAYRQQRSNIQVEVSARVKKVLPDDNTGSRHQKCILILPSGHTLLLAHNIDLAQRVPLEEGDQIELSGEYEYSRQGGVVHWTHHDPNRHHANGWIRVRGKTYQ